MTPPFSEWYEWLVLERFWIGWLVTVLVLGLLTRFVPAARKLEPLLRWIFWAGVVGFFVWMTRGRVVLFAGIGSVVALGALTLLAFKRASSPVASQLPTAARMMTRPALVLGVLVGIATECCGRLSGGPFVIWRGALGAVVVLVAGLVYLARASRT